jgi:hypothetical protein
MRWRTWFCIEVPRVHAASAHAPRLEHQFCHRRVPHTAQRRRWWRGTRGAAEINDGYVPGRLTVQARTEREKMADS